MAGLTVQRTTVAAGLSTDCGRTGEGQKNSKEASKIIQVLAEPVGYPG